MATHTAAGRNNTARAGLVHRAIVPADPASHTQGFNDDYERELHHIIQVADAQAFNGRVYWVAALGFLTDSYNLFASNVVLPALSFVYWNTTENRLEYGFNIATLLGSMVGQIVFGFAVDIYGRKALYGFELLIVIISTIGLLQCSEGVSDGQGNTTWSPTPWLFFWRCIMGIGIGAEYPLSATIAAEWSSKASRARMMSAVFFMQPLGQCLAYVVGLVALTRLGSSRVDMDKFWRVVIGIGAFPTIFALLVRFLIPESWRFTYLVVKNTGQATVDSSKVYDNTTANGLPQHDKTATEGPVVNGAQATQQEDATPWQPGSQFRGNQFGTFLWKPENRAKLAGVSACWFLLDVGFYGMGFNSPSTLSKLWTSSPLTFENNAPWWQSNSDVSSGTFDGHVVTNGLDKTTGAVASDTIHAIMFDNMLHAFFTTSIAALIGSALLVIFIERVNRRKLLIGTFAALAVVLAAIAGSMHVLFHKEGVHWVLVVLWAVAQVLYNLGPNSLIFILPAEIFPTRYRCTCYGIAAASGKLGAVFVQSLIWGLSSGRYSNGPNDYIVLQWLMVGFSICMALGAVIACFPAAIPDVQEHGTRGMNLELLSDDRTNLPQRAADAISLSSL